jgi:competence protein ComEA
MALERESLVANTASPPPLWGWTPAARGLLAWLGIFLALAMVIVGMTPSGITAPPLPDLVLDPNTAPPEVLTILPRMGPVLLGRVVAARRDRPFDSLDSIDRRIKGVGPKTIALWAPYLRIEPTPEPAGLSP